MWIYICNKSTDKTFMLMFHFLVRLLSKTNYSCHRRSLGVTCSSYSQTSKYFLSIHCIDQNETFRKHQKSQFNLKYPIYDRNYYITRKSDTLSDQMSHINSIFLFHFSVICVGKQFLTGDTQVFL